MTCGCGWGGVPAVVGPCVVVTAELDLAAAAVEIVDAAVVVANWVACAAFVANRACPTLAASALLASETAAA